MIKYKNLFIIILITLSSFSLLGCAPTSESIKILEEEQVNNEVEYESLNPSLTSNQLEEFQEYAETENEQLLIDLSPMDIFKYYYHAFKINDYKVLYGLYIKGEAYGTPSEREFLENLKNKDILQMVLLKRLEYNIKSLAQIKYDEKTSYIQVKFKEDNELTKSEQWNFKLIKNNNNIWKLEWLPLK